MRECSGCGFPLEAMGLSECPKCDDYAPISRNTQGTLEIDIAHAGETWEQAKAKIDRALNDALYYNHKALKVIHGYGSSGGKGIIGSQARPYLRMLAERYEGRFATDRNTPGASLIWLNR